MREQYDVIVVGAGSAGAAAAAGLSADPARHVLLLEAGIDWRADAAPPALRSANVQPFMHDPAHQARWQWPELTARRTSAQAAKFYWRGRALGGSSVVNAQIAIRGVAAAFDAWAEAGCEGWDGAAMRRVFATVEDDAMHGRRGVLPVFRTPEAQWGAVDRGLRDAALAAGYRWNPDLNDAEAEGISAYPINSRDGQRVTTNDAFLEPARNRANLHIVGETTVDRVVFEGSRAAGVRLRRAGGPWREVRAPTVLLCAGAIHSPAILMRSGIGPASALAALGIPILRDLPEIGRNLMDHPVLRATIPLRSEIAPTDPDSRHTNCCLTYTSGLGGGGFRDMIMIAFNHRGLGVGGAPSGEGAIGVSLFEAFARGTLTLSAADPDAQPVVDLNMLDHPADRLRMRDGLRRLASLVVHPALAGLSRGITFAGTRLTMAEAASLPAGELDTLMLQEAADGQHAAGTCRMTAYEEPRGVVDPDLCVKGIGGLRVADASIMPADCRANLHFTCVAIGVRAAELIAAAG